MNINITLTKEDLKKLIADKISEMVNITVDPKFIQIQTKSSQNYKAEWEEAEFKATYVRYE